MYHLLITFFLGINTLNAMYLDKIIKHALVQSPSLESLNAKIKANKQEIIIAQQFENPELLLTTNTLDSSQAMSQTSLSLKQKIPYFSKRDKREKIAIAEENILTKELHAAKVSLVAMIKNEAYTIWELQKLKKITQEYIRLTQRNVELYEAYVSTSSNQHMGIMKAKLSLSELQIKITTLNAKIDTAFARLSYLASFKVDTLDIELHIKNKPDLKTLHASLHNNPLLAIKAKEVFKEKEKINLAKSNKYPDFTVVAGVSYRENFDNYANLGFGITLPIYGTEDAKEQKARATALAMQNQEADVRISLNASLHTYYAQMVSAYEIYHIVNDDALPQIEHMFELSNSSISTGGDLFKYIDVLFEKLKLQKQTIHAVANYNRANAKISELAGKLK